MELHFYGIDIKSGKFCDHSRTVSRRRTNWHDILGSFFVRIYEYLKLLSLITKQFHFRQIFLYNVCVCFLNIQMFWFSDSQT